MPAGLHVKLPAMPGTRDARTTDVSFTQRTTSVGADTVHRVELIADAKERDDTIADGQLTAGTGGKVIDAADEVTGHAKRTRGGGSARRPQATRSVEGSRTAGLLERP